MECFTIIKPNTLLGVLNISESFPTSFKMYINNVLPRLTYLNTKPQYKSRLISNSSSKPNKASNVGIRRCLFITTMYT